jgi:hypothetical protein
MVEQLSDEQQESARELKLLIEEKCIENGIISIVSLPTCEDVIFHHEKDLQKLVFSHEHVEGIHPSKHIGYLAFWIRKLKPIAYGYETEALLTEIANGNHTSSISESEEVVSVNEIAPIYVALHLILAYAQTGNLDPMIPETRRDEHVGALESLIKKALLIKSDAGHSQGDVFQSLCNYSPLST